MTKKPKRKYTRRQHVLQLQPPPTSCVVYVHFPNSSVREYCYLCDFPVKVGDYVIANGTRVMVHRVAAFDSIATKHVQRAPSQNEVARNSRICDIAKRLNELLAQQKKIDEYATLARKNPEAKQLLAELKKLRK